MTFVHVTIEQKVEILATVSQIFEKKIMTHIFKIDDPYHKGWLQLDHVKNGKK